MERRLTINHLADGTSLLGMDDGQNEYINVILTPAEREQLVQALLADPWTIDKIDIKLNKRS